MIKLDDGREVVEDGESVRVPLHLCDARQRWVAAKYKTADADLADHRPRHGVVTDDVRKVRQETRADYQRQLSDAWRSPQRGGFQPSGKLDSGGTATSDADADPAQRRRAAYDGYVKRLTDAWRGPVRDAAQPDLGTRPEELAVMRRPTAADPAAAVEHEGEVEAWQGKSIEELQAEAEKKRDAIHAQYASDLSNAWKNPVGIAGIKPRIISGGPKHMVIDP